MRKTAGLMLIILTVLVLINMPAFKGLSVIQLDRPSDLPVGEDPDGALGIIDLDQGLSGAIPIGSTAGSADRYMGTITNNFDFEVQLNVTLLIRSVLNHDRGQPRWQNVNIYIDRESTSGVRVRIATLNYNNFGIGTIEQQRTTGAIFLDRGEALVVTLDRASNLHQFNNVNSFQANASFTIAGSSTGAENITFTIKPRNDLRRQYFIKGSS